MATLDEILGGSSPDSGGHAPKGTKEWTEQHSGDNAPVSSPPTAPPAPAKQNGTPPTDGGTPAGGGGYEALFRHLTLIPHQQRRNLKKKRRNSEEMKSLLQLGMALWLSPISFLRHRAHRTCTQARTPCRSVQKSDMTS